MTKSDAIEVSLLSKSKRRNNKQLWVFLTDESPLHTNIWPEYKNIFNWSMTYRSNSDVPVPYGRTIPKKYNKLDTNKLITKNINKKNKLVAIMGSNCSTKNSQRWLYVKNILNILLKLNDTNNQLDIIGHCLNGNKKICPGHFKKDCKYLNSYKFYLSFENSNCDEYLTEKIYWNAYDKYSVPIIMGPTKINCQNLLPPHSYIHVDDFNTTNDLINYIIYLNNNYDKYIEYHLWRYYYDVVNEHGYFGSSSKHYCRLCQAIIINDKTKTKVYNYVEDFWNKKQCVY